VSRSTRREVPVKQSTIAISQAASAAVPGAVLYGEGEEARIGRQTGGFHETEKNTGDERSGQDSDSDSCEDVRS